MDHDTVTSSMLQSMGSMDNQGFNSIVTLFDKNLQRINEKLKFVDLYYTSKNKHSFENHHEVTTIKEPNKLVYEENVQSKSINYFSELHKITLNEIETIRKTHVRQILKKKAFDRENVRRKCSTTSNLKDEEEKRELREGLIIDRSYTKHLLNSNSDQHQARLQENKNTFDQKTRDIKYALVLKIASGLLNDIKKVLNESCTSLDDTQIRNFILLEDDFKKFQNISRNSNDQNLFAINLLVKNIQNFNEELLKGLSKKAQAEKFSFKIEDDNNENKNAPIKNFTFKMNKEDKLDKNVQNNSSKINNESNTVKNEVQNFTFKIMEDSDVKPSELSTFKFQTSEEANVNDINSFSFNIKDPQQNNESKNNTSYNFEDDYKQFLENHLSLQKHLKNFEGLYHGFLHDDNLKSFRNELTKAINTPVNSISSVSSWHMKDKFEKLNALLNCKTVQTGNSTVSANSHKDALNFCKDTLAKKIINVGEQVASVKTETAFDVASIVTELWKSHPDFGILLYARFKQKCPCLIPYNAPKTSEETDEEYYKSLGYNYTDGVVEKQDKYIKRMTGIIRLFAAFVVTETKNGKALGIGQSWMLIAATVSLTPQLDITAILMHEMLVITGYDLKQAYGKQFIKMLQYINTKYMQKIEEITPLGCGGPVQRLKTFISKSIQLGYIDKPKGIIPRNFW